MTGKVAFEAWGSIDPKFILEAAPDSEAAPVGVTSPDTSVKPQKGHRFHNGWVAAIICLFVGLGVYGGMLWLGRDPGQTPVGGTAGETYTREEVSFADREPEYIEPCDFTFTITGMEIELTYLRTENDETDGCLVDVYTDNRNVEYRFFSRTRVLKRFYDEDRRLTKGICAFEEVAENARQVVYDHAWLFWSHNHEGILKEAEGRTYIYEIDHTIDSRFDKETLYMAFNSDGQLYAYTYEDHGFFSQCVARSNVELFIEICEALPAGWGYLTVDKNDHLCYTCEEIVPVPPEEQITDEDGYVISPGCGDHKHVFTALPILSINPPEKPPLPSEMIFGFSYSFRTPEYEEVNQMTVARGESFVINGGMSFDADFDTKTYGQSEELFPTVIFIAEDGTEITAGPVGGYSKQRTPEYQDWVANRKVEIPTDAPTGKYDVKVFYGEKSEVYQDVLTVTE